MTLEEAQICDTHSLKELVILVNASGRGRTPYDCNCLLILTLMITNLNILLIFIFFSRNGTDFVVQFVG
jgi:hypothetical protein